LGEGMVDRFMMLLGIVIAAVLAALSALHLYWAAGGRWGHAAALPEHRGRPAFQPGPVATVIVAVLLAAAVALVLGRVGLGPVARLTRLTYVGAWIVAAAFLLRGLGDFRLVGVFRRVRDTRFAWWDRHVYTPLAVLLGLGTAVVAAGTT